ncbi:MAG: nucleoside recognition domain-containing protein, partial [Myxococcota bacterium]
MLNGIFFALILSATLYGAFAGTMAEVSQASIDSAKSAVELALSLIGQMALWLGLAQVLQDAGLMRVIARSLRPVMRFIFPDIPDGHPALTAILLNIVANMIGLTNAATPFGIKAMIELNKLNKRPGVATNAMCLFLAINTSGVAVLPTGVIAIRAAQGADNPTGIFFPSILATMCSTIVGFLVCAFLQRLSIFSPERSAPPKDTAASEAAPDISGLEQAESIADKVGAWSVARGFFAMAVGVVLLAAMTMQAYLQVLLGVDTLGI